MAITINWFTQIISVPKVDTQLVQSVPTEIRQLDLNVFRLVLKDLEDDEEGIPFLDTHRHNPPVPIGGVTLARVVEIINGYTITFEDGQYAVNLVGANSNVGDVVNVNQVSVRSQNSAGLTFSKQSEDTSFIDARVWIDMNEGLPGTVYPRGTASDPVNNLADAQTIIATRTLPKRLHLRGSLVVVASEDISDYDIMGSSSKLATLDVQTGAITTNLVIESMSITGDFNGNITARDVETFATLTDFDGKMVLCGLGGTTDLGVGAAASHDFIDCYSEVPGNSRPTIDANGLADLDIQLRRYSGGINIVNFSGANSRVSIDLVAGTVDIAADCTDGVILVRGVGELIDNSGPGCNVIQEGLVKATTIELARKIAQNKLVTDPVTGKITLFDDDGSILIEGNLFEDAAGQQAYRGQGAERRERLV